MANTRFSDDVIKIIVSLHKDNKTPKEISDILNVTYNGVRLFLKRNSFIPHTKPKRDRSRPCAICGVSFIPFYDDGIKKEGCKTCSKQCLKKLFASHKIKYTQKQIDRVIELKRQSISNKDICEITGVNVNKIKEIVKQNNLYISPEQAQKNAHSARFKKGESNFSYEEYYKKIKLIEKDILDGRGTAHGLAIEYGLNPNSVTAIFRKEDKVHLLGIKESTGQKSLYEFTCDNVGKENVLYNDRITLKPKELDVHVVNKKIAIEYCGLRWHTEKMAGKNAHYNKMRKANELGIRLITIFAHEWYSRNNQIKNFLKSALGISKQTFAGRKTQVRIVEHSIGKKFMDNYHIQGSTRTSLIYLGIFFEETLLGVLSLGRHHRGANNTIIVLDRLCFLDNITVQGGASKLLKYAKIWAKENGYAKMISWSDNRWSEGNVYKKMGFTLEEELKPDYFYAKERQAYSKQSLKKNKEEKLSGKTEKELRKEQGYERVYDCGKKRWILML